MNSQCIRNLTIKSSCCLVLSNQSGERRRRRRSRGQGSGRKRNAMDSSQTERGKNCLIQNTAILSTNNKHDNLNAYVRIALLSSRPKHSTQDTKPMELKRWFRSCYSLPMRITLHLNRNPWGLVVFVRLSMRGLKSLPCWTNERATIPVAASQTSFPSNIQLSARISFPNKRPCWCDSPMAAVDSSLRNRHQATNMLTVHCRSTNTGNIRERRFHSTLNRRINFLFFQTING